MSNLESLRIYEHFQVKLQIFFHFCRCFWKTSMNVRSMKTCVKMVIAPIHLAASCVYVMMASVWMIAMPFVLVSYT
jgi:hypothetical protein